MTFILGGCAVVAFWIAVSWVSTLCGFGKAERTRIEAMRDIWPQGR